MLERVDHVVLLHFESCLVLLTAAFWLSLIEWLEKLIDSVWEVLSLQLDETLIEIVLIGWDVGYVVVEQSLHLVIQVGLVSGTCSHIRAEIFDQVFFLDFFDVHLVWFHGLSEVSKLVEYLGQHAVVARTLWFLRDLLELLQCFLVLILSVQDVSYFDHIFLF